MQIGLINIEPKIFNTAYMQISEYFKNAMCGVALIDPGRPAEYEGCDKLFCSSLFGFTDKANIPSRAVCGGTGFDVKTKLPPEIACAKLDYSLYPECKTSYLWFSRGCIRDCSFCVVRQKEGKLKSVKPKNLNFNGDYITVMDNNFFANPAWLDAIEALCDYGQPVDFQGVDVRLLTPEMCESLAILKHRKRIKIAWDNPFEDLRDQIAMLLQYVKAYKVMCYVLIGHNSSLQQDVDRVRSLEQFGITPYVMCMNRQDKHQKKFQRWVNGHAYRNVKWEGFLTP